MDVTLTWSEVLHGAIGGVIRQATALQRGLDEARAGRPVVSGWERHIEGAIAELAVAKVTGSYWEPGQHFRPEGKRDDVAGVSVRSTNRRDGSLIVRPEDAGDVRYWLALTHELPVVKLVGTILGRDARQRQWWRAPNGRPGAYFVPQSALERVEYELAALDDGVDW